MLNSLLFLVLPFFGWSVLRCSLGINNLVYLLPFSFVFGLVAFLVLLYTLTYFIGIQNGALFAIFILALLAILLLFVYRKDFFKIENSLKTNELLVLFIACLFILFFTCLISKHWIILDFRFHIAVASYFASTNKFPNGVPDWPSLFIPYHFGFDLLSAAVSKVANISIINSFHLIVLVSCVVTFLSSFAIAYFFSKELIGINNEQQAKVCSFLGGLFFYFSGNLLWVDALFRFSLKIPPVDSSWSLFKAICGLGMHGSIMNDLGSSGILFPSSTVGFQLFLLLLFLFFKFLNSDSLQINYLIGILLTSLALFHTAEWILYVFLLALVISPLISLVLRDSSDFKKIFLRKLTCVFIFSVVIVFNGFMYKILSAGYSYIPGFLSLSFNPNFLIKAFGRFGDLNQHRDIYFFSWDFISEFGFQIIFLIPVIYWAIRKKIKWVSFIIAFLLISFISPFLIYIKTSPPDSIRLFHPGFELLSLIFALWIFDSCWGVLQYALLFSVILPPIFTLVMSGIFSPGIYLSYPFIDFVGFSIGELKKEKDVNKFFKNVNDAINILKEGSIISKSDIEVASYLKEHSKPYEYGISNYSLPFDYIGIPCYSMRGSSFPKRVTYINLLKTLDPYLAGELKVKWLYIDPQTANNIDSNRLQELIKEGFLKEAFAVSNQVYGDFKFKLYEFLDMDRYFNTYPRKAYWTFFTYLGQNIIPIYAPSGSGVVCLFKTEKEATNFLMEEIKSNLEFKEYNPSVDAIDVEIVKKQAIINRLGIKYF